MSRHLLVLLLVTAALIHFALTFTLVCTSKALERHFLHHSRPQPGLQAAP